MTTKFFEMLAVDQPILCVRGDEGCLEEAILRTQSGIAAHTVDEVCLFIKRYYDEWLETGHVTAHIDHTEAEKFSRRTQAQQFIRIFEQL